MANNLNTFKVLYIVKGCLLAFSSFFIFAYIIFFSFIFNNTNSNFHYEMQSQGGELPFNPFTIVQYLISIGVVFSVLFIALIVCTFITAHYIAKRKHYYFVFTIAILNCFTGLLGLLLGVFTIIEITKPEVKALFFNKDTHTNDHESIVSSES